MLTPSDEIRNMSAEAKINYLIRCKDKFIKDIKEGICLFSDNEKVIQSNALLVNHLMMCYECERKLSDLEMSVLNKIILKGFRSVSFLPLTEVGNSVNKKILMELLTNEKYVILGDAGYINIEI